MLVSQPDFFAQAQRALQVPRDRLADVGAIRVLGRQPIGELLVELRPLSLREAPIGRLDDESVREAPPPSRLVLRLHQSAAVERGESCPKLVGPHLGGERAQCPGAEPAPLDRGAFEDQARHAVEAVEPGGEQRLQGRGNLDRRVTRTQPAAVDEEPLIREHRRQLLQVQRVPLGRLADPVDEGRRGILSEQQLADPPGVLLRERRQGRRERAGLAGSPGRTLLEQLGTGEAQEENGAVHALDDRVGQVEHRRLCPVQVIQHHDERPLGGEHLEQPPHRPRCVGSERVADAEELGEPVTDGVPVRLCGHQRAERERHRPSVSRGTLRRL
jgi:hypothetical protein